MKTNLLIQYLGIDSWHRAVYKVLNKEGLFLKAYAEHDLKLYEERDIFYVAYSFEGEPEHFLDTAKFNVVVYQGVQCGKDNKNETSIEILG